MTRTEVHTSTLALLSCACASGASDGASSTFGSSFDAGEADTGHSTESDESGSDSAPDMLAETESDTDSESTGESDSTSDDSTGSTSAGSTSDDSTESDSTSEGSDRCDPGFDDCDLDPLNGCEADLASTTDCGVCGKSCELASGPLQCAGGTCSGTITISDLADSYVADDAGSSNYGASAEVLVDGDPDIYRTFIRIVQHDIPADATISDATLFLTGFNPGNTAKVRRVTADWQEGTITWNAQPTVDGADVTTFLPLSGGLQVEIGPLVQSWVDGTYADFGLRLHTDGTDGSDFRSTEYGVMADRPRLEITLFY